VREACRSCAEPGPATCDNGHSLFGWRSCKAHRGQLLEDKGIGLFMVLQRLFGPVAIQPNQVVDRYESSATNEDCKKGSDAAYKIQAVFSGTHALQNDSDYLAARESIKAFSDIPNYFPPGATEDQTIGGELLRTLYYNRARDLLGQGTPT